MKIYVKVWAVHDGDSKFPALFAKKRDANVYARDYCLSAEILPLKIHKTLAGALK